MSNVDMATEMTNMITAERGYQANSRVITTADEMLGTLVRGPVAVRSFAARGAADAEPHIAVKGRRIHAGTDSEEPGVGRPCRKPSHPVANVICEGGVPMITLNRLGHNDEPFHLNTT